MTARLGFVINFESSTPGSHLDGYCLLQPSGSLHRERYREHLLFGHAVICSRCPFLMSVPSFEALKERKIGQWALAYLAGAWVLLQVVSLINNNFK